MTPLSIISLYKSLPSRVRSPTPAKTEKPPDHEKANQIREIATSDSSNQALLHTNHELWQRC